jgi:hypothetical protein
MQARENARRFIPALSESLKSHLPNVRIWLSRDLRYGHYPELIVSNEGRNVPVVLFIDGSTAMCPSELCRCLIKRFSSPSTTK